MQISVLLFFIFFVDTLSSLLKAKCNAPRFKKGQESCTPTSIALRLFPAVLQDVYAQIGRVKLEGSLGQIGHRPISLLAGSQSQVLLLLFLPLSDGNSCKFQRPKRVNRNHLHC